MNIWKNLEFTKFFASFTIGNIGDWFDIFALQIIFVHEWRASPIILSILILIYFIPSIILSPIAGAWADRLSKRNLMIVTDVLAAILTVGLFFSGSIPAALMLLLIRSCIVSINVPAQQAYIKTIVTDDELLQASSYTTVVFQMCKVIGPMLGAAVLVLASARTCIAINASSFFLSAFILMSLPKDAISVDKNVKVKVAHLRKDMFVGAKYIWDEWLIRTTMGIVMVWFFCSLVRQTQLAIFLAHLFPHKPNTLGVFMGFDGFGAVVSSAILSRKAILRCHGFYFFSGFILLGLGILGLSMYQLNWPFYLLYSLAIIIGLGTGILLVNYSYIIKKETPMDKIGCVSGITSALQNFALTIGTASSGFLVLQFGIHEVYFGLSIIMFILAFFSLILLNTKRN